MGGKSSSQVVGYRNYITFHMWLCSGPVDLLTEMRYGDRQCFLGNQSPGTFSFDRSDLFNGEGDEGGISGTFTLEDGDAAQGVNSVLDTLYEGDTPAFRNVSQVVGDDIYIGNNPYAKSLSFAPTRIQQLDNYGSQWNSSEAAIASQAVENWNEGTGDLQPLNPGLTQGDSFPISGDDPLTATHNRLYRLNASQSVTYQTSSLAASGFTLSPGDDGYWMRINGGIFNANFAQIFWSVQELTGNATSLDMTATVTFEAGQAAAFPTNTCQYIIRAIEADGSTNIILASGSVPYSEFAEYSEALTVPDGYAYIELEMQSGLNGGFRDIRITGGNGSLTPNDINPAHIIREVLTDTRFGVGRATSSLDTAAFAAFATQLHTEDFGLSVKWKPGSSTPFDLIADILDYVDGVHYIDRQTGLDVVKLIRASDTAIAFGADAILDGELTPEKEEELPSKCIVKYTDRRHQREASISAHNPALRRNRGYDVPTERNYVYVHREALAAQLAERELRQASTVKLLGWVDLDRSGYLIHPGQKITLTSPKLNVSGVTFRVLDVDPGDGIQNRIKCQVAQDVFDMVTDTITIEDRPTDPAIVAPQAVTTRVVQEAPYYFVATEVGDQQAEDEFAGDNTRGYVFAAAEAPTPAHIRATLHLDAGLTGSYEEVDAIDFGPGDVLAADMAKYATTLTVADATGFNDVELNDLAQIGDEIVRVTNVSGTTITVERGFLDTVPVPHSSGETAMLFGPYYEVATEEFNDGETTGVKFVTRTARAQLSIGGATQETITFDSRGIRPYPAQNLQLEGALEPGAIADGDELTWDRRNRLDTIPVPFDDGDQTPETGTTYRVDTYLLNSPTEATPGSTSWTSTVSAGPVTLNSSDYETGRTTETHLRIIVTALRDGFESWQSPEITVALGATMDSETITMDSTETTMDQS